MKLLSSLVLALAAGPVLAAPTPPGPELRVLLQREKAAAPVPVPRQLTEPERAELRRQLGASRQAPPPRP